MYRVGIGHDTHRTETGGPLRLGGIDVPHDCHLVGHSDADVLLHAVVDALLGAAALGDIGELFPNTDEANRNRDSADMLQVAYREVQRLGYEVVNLDCIVFAQTPKLRGYKTAIQDRIAKLLGVRPNQVGVKAKTGESVGPVGREEAVMAQCVALLQSNQSNHEFLQLSTDRDVHRNRFTRIRFHGKIDQHSRVQHADRYKGTI